VIDRYITHDILDHLNWVAFRLIQDPRWALCPAGSCSTWRFPLTDWVLLKLLFTVSMSMVRVQWERSNLGAKSETWNLRWHAMSLIPTPHTIYCWGDYGFIATPSSHLLFIRSWNMLMEDGKVWMLIAKKHPFKGYRITLLIFFSIKILLRSIRIPSQKIQTLKMKLTPKQSLKKNASGNWTHL